MLNRVGVRVPPFAQLKQTIDRFEWDHPEKLDRDLVDRLIALDFVDRDETCCSRAAVVSARP